MKITEERMGQLLPQNIIDSQLSLASKKVLAAMLDWYQNSKAKETKVVTISNKVLCAIAGVGGTSLQESLRELNDFNLVSRRIGTKLGDASEYTIHFKNLLKPLKRMTFEEMFSEELESLENPISTTLHNSTLHNSTLHNSTLHNSTLHNITEHNITLHNIEEQNSKEEKRKENNSFFELETECNANAVEDFEESLKAIEEDVTVGEAKDLIDQELYNVKTFEDLSAVGGEIRKFISRFNEANYREIKRYFEDKVKETSNRIRQEAMAVHEASLPF